MPPSSIFSLSNDSGMSNYDISRDLLDAASYGLNDKIKLSIAAGADLDFAPNGISPTSIAVNREFLESLKLLVDAGARSDIKNRIGWTAVHQAAEKDTSDFIDVILSKPDQVNLKVVDDDGVNPLSAALLKNRVANAEKIFKTCPESSFIVDVDGLNLPLKMVVEKNLEALQWCLEKGISVDKEDFKGRTARVEAAKKWPEAFDLINSIAGKDVVVSQDQLAEKERQSSVSSEPEKTQEEVNPFGLVFNKPQP